MKKIFTLLILTLFILPLNIKAANFSTYISGTSSITPSAEFTVNFGVNTSDSILGIVAKLNYDSTKLSIVSSSGSNGFNLTIGSNLVLDSINSKTGSFTYATITFKALPSFLVGETTTVSVTNLSASTGTIDLTGSGSSITIGLKSTDNNLSSLSINNSIIPGFNPSKTSYSITVNNDVTTASITANLSDSRSSITGTGNKQLNVYSNTFYIVVTSQSGSKKTYTVTIIRKDTNGLTYPLSDDNSLSSLTIEGYQLDFSKDKTLYELTVENNITKISINATPSHNKASLNIPKINELQVGKNTIEITVTAENKNQKKYTIIVNRKNDGPTTTIKDFLNVASTTSASNIVIKLTDDNTKISKDILEFIQKNKKDLIIEKYKNDELLYKWEISGKNIRDLVEIDALISFNTENKAKIDKLSNYSNNFYLNFNHSGKLPEDTYITINLNGKYNENDKINLYYYDNNSIEKIYSDLEVKNGVVRFKLEHASEYLLSMSEIKGAIISNNNNNSNNNILLIIVHLIILVALLVEHFILIRRLKRKTQ